MFNTQLFNGESLKFSSDTEEFTNGPTPHCPCWFSPQANTCPCSAVIKKSHDTPTKHALTLYPLLYTEEATPQGV